MNYDSCFADPLLVMAGNRCAGARLGAGEDLSVTTQRSPWLWLRVGNPGRHEGAPWQIRSGRGPIVCLEAARLCDVDAGKV